MIGSRLALLLVLLWTAPGWAAIAHVQTVSCQAQAATSCTTPSTTTTTGNLFVASAGWEFYSGFVTFTGITDNKGNAYSSAVPDTSDTAGGVWTIRQDYVAAGTGGSGHTFTVTVSAAYSATVAVSEISGAAASPLDRTAVGADSAGSSHATASTATTTQANEMLVGAGIVGDVITLACGGSYTERTNIPYNGTDNSALLVCTRGVTATGAYTFDFTTSAGARSASALSTWKEAAAAGVRQRCVGCGADGKVIE